MLIGWSKQKRCFRFRLSRPEYLCFGRFLLTRGAVPSPAALAPLQGGTGGVEGGLSGGRRDGSVGVKAAAAPPARPGLAGLRSPSATVPPPEAAVPGPSPFVVPLPPPSSLLCSSSLDRSLRR